MTVASPPRPQLGLPDPKYMSFVEHLEELRHRLMISMAAIAAGSVGGWFLAKPVIHLFAGQLRQYLHADGLVVSQVYGIFTLELKIAMIIGFAFALPVTVWQLWSFLLPAFGTRAYRYGPLFIGSALLLFAAGVFTGFEVIPLALQFFGKFQGSDVTVLPFAADYIGFITLILLVFGISFELPLVLVSLSIIGITSSAALSRKRMHFFFGIFIFSTVATPGADVASPIILGGILYVLFEISILVSRFIGK